jgi:hypothetical protein
MKTVVAVALVLAITVTSLAGAAWALSEKTVLYGFDRVWPAAVRFLRVDEGLTVTEKDAETGYVLFELREEGKRFPGALELIRTTVGEREAIQLVLRIEDRPDYVEQGILARLETKLRKELGEPPPAVKKRPPPAPAPEPAPAPTPTHAEARP